MKQTFISFLIILVLWPVLAQAQLHFPTSLTNELDNSPIDENARDIVVLIHGWTAMDTIPADYNRYEDAKGAPELNYLFNILKVKLIASGKKLVTYHWEEDATTGGVVNEVLVFDFAGYGNATEAAVNAQQHGGNLAMLLRQAAPNLRTVHFIAHSAGAWAAREAAKSLLTWLKNPYVVVQVTFLDPFIPDANFGMTTGLSTPVMSGTDELTGADRIYRLENYYSDDRLVAACLKPPTISTQERFDWRAGRDINLEVEWGIIPLVACYIHYPTHSGPIEFYADTVKASIQGETVPWGLYGTGCPFEFIQVGWYRSIFSEDLLLPRITSHPQGQSVQAGGTASFSVTANRADSFRWFKNGQQYSATDSTLTLNSVSATDAGEYVVRVSNSAGQVFSEKAVLQVTSTPAPTISDVLPRTLNALPLPQTQLITIAGTGFTVNSRLTFNDGVNLPYIDRVPTFISATELRYNIAVGPNPAPWSVKVVNGAVESLPYMFYVVSGGAQLTGLSISGPTAIAENNNGNNGQFTATAYFSDGSSSTVTSSTSWSENSSATSISSSGLLTAGSVSSDTTVTVSASYTAGSITRTASANVTVVNTGGGGTQTQELIGNGGFESGKFIWSANTLSGGTSGSADILQGSYPRPGGTWYAYVGDRTATSSNALGSLHQPIHIPANATSIVLNFYLNVVTAETTLTSWDKMDVNLRTASDVLIKKLRTFSEADKDANTSGSYSLFTIDMTTYLAAYKDQDVILQFYVDTDSAKYTIFRIDDVSVQASVPLPVALSSLAINGPSSVTEGNTAQYSATAVFSDGLTQMVTPNIWDENSSATTISSSGLMMAGQVGANTTVTLYASYTNSGVTREARKDVTVINQAATFSYLAISGPSSMNENSSGQFTATAIFSDGTSQPVTPSWSANSTATSISSGGLLTAGDVGNDTTVTVSANYTTDGVTRNASQDVLIINKPTPLTLISLAIIGASSVNENSTAQYSATAFFSDGTSQTVTPTWSEDSAATTISIFGLFSTGEVTSDTSVTVSASYTTGGITRDAQKSVTVINTDNVTATINSISPNPATQGTTVNFSGTGSDSSGHSITAYSWRSSLDGIVGTSASFGKDNLSVGSHNIYLKVQCSNGTWSPETSWSENPLVIGQMPPHPVVTTTSPADGAIDVSVNTTITATFSESMDASTISGSTFTINNGVTGTVTYDDTTQTATFTPSENLNYLTKYTATITKDVKDLAGNPITDDYSWSFTTVPEPTPTPTPTVTEVAPKVSGGHWHTVALKSDGTVWTWGHNFDGELGDGTTNTRYLPAQVDGLNNVIAVGAGNYHTIALKSDGTIWIWGHNGSGELGDGTITNRTTPIQVSGLSGVSAIAGGVFHTIALKLDGTVWTWGANWVGQLGDGTTIDKSTSVQVTGLSDVIAIDGAYHHTAALKSDGTVWTWGANDYGQLGDGTNTNRTTLVQVNGLIDVTAIACGDDHTIALKSDGTVWAWGHNDDGQLGDETTNDRPAPVQVSGLSGVTAIAAGDDHTVVLKSDGTVWAWGNNGDGQLGDMTTTNSTAPVQVIGLSDVVTIGAGNYHTIAMKADGTVWTWGANNDGQLGDGTNTNESTPVQANINLIQTVTPTPNQTPTGMPIPTVGPTPLPTPSPTPTSVVTPTPSPTPTTTPPPIPTPIPGNIEFHYTFDEGVGTVAHDSASSNDGTINGATWTTGKDGSGLSFNGNDDSVQIPGFMGQPQNITISAWAKLSSNDINGAEVISLGDHVALRLDGTGSKGVMGFYYDGATWRTTTTGISYAGTGWHHFVYVVDDANTMQKIYVDGVERGSTAHTQPISYAGLGANTLIGKHGNGSGNYDFNGVIDDVCVYNRALNAQEILALYDQLPAQATAPYARSSMTIDGNLTESSWDITTDVSNVVIGTANNTVKFGVLWDSTYLYVGMTVLDDTLHNDSTYVHEDDSVEIYIDGDHNHSTTYDSYDRQFLKGWFDSTLVEQHGKTAGVLHGWAPISGGYSIELAIPWNNLGITPAAGMTLGFSVGYNDDDNGAGRDGQAVWIGTADNYLDTSALGDIVLEEPPPSVTVPYVSTNLDVDGNVSESDWNITYDVSKVVIGTTNNTVKFGVLWNSACLYVGMEVLDGNLYNDSTYVHEDDSVEIYIDGDHNHGTTYDSYDRQFLKGWFDSALVEQHGKTAGVLHGWAPIPGGYSIELAIPWSNLGITPAAGVTFGFSVGYNDDDNGEGRDGQAVWIGTANNWRDTSALGDIVLGAASPPTPTPLPTPIATPLLTPTPTLLSGGLDALYAFDEGIGTVANDLSGNDNHGTINGATWTIGKTDWALSFDGVNDYVDLGNPSNLQPGAVSLSVWFKTTAASGMIMRKRGYGYGLEVVSSGKISFWIYNATATKFMATSLNAYNDDQWHHAVGVYDGSTVKLFIDGSKVSAESADPIFYGSGGIAIGRDGNYSGSYFNGIIDEVQVYNYALSDPEIQGLYNANTGASSMASLHSLDLNKDTDNARITPSTGIALKSFHAEVDHDGSVSLHWETAAEVDTAGFNLYRSRHKTGRYTKINNSLINARSDDPSGTRYNFMDEPGHGKSYYYKLENEDTYGKSTMYDTIKVRKKSSGNE